MASALCTLITSGISPCENVLLNELIYVHDIDKMLTEVTCLNQNPSSPSAEPFNKFLSAAIWELTLGSVSECLTVTCKAAMSWEKAPRRASVENAVLRPDRKPADLGATTATETPDLYASLGRQHERSN